MLVVLSWMHAGQIVVLFLFALVILAEQVEHVHVMISWDSLSTSVLCLVCLCRDVVVFVPIGAVVFMKGLYGCGSVDDGWRFAGRSLV